MSQKRFTSEQTIANLHEAEVEVSRGQVVGRDADGNTIPVPDDRPTNLDLARTLEERHS